MKKLIFLTIMFLSSISLFSIEKGQTLPDVILNGEDGGKINGAEWKSSDMISDVILYYYFDPDEAGMNKDVLKEMTKYKLENRISKENFKIVAVMDLDSSWKPTSMIESVLKEKSEDKKKGKFIKRMILDKKGVMREKWGLNEDSSTFILADSKGRVLFYKNGKITENDKSIMKKVIKENI